MKRFFFYIVGCLLASYAGQGMAKELSNADLLEAAVAKGRDAPRAGMLGTHNGTDVIVENFGDIRIIRYDVDNTKCEDVDGVIRTVGAPTGVTSTIQRFCVPGVLMGVKEKPKKEMD